MFWLQNFFKGQFNARSTKDYEHFYDIPTNMHFFAHAEL